MKPLLAHIYEPHRVTYPCWVQPKLNGVRALYQNGRFQSRDEIPWNASLLEHIAVHLRNIIPLQVILDGELYVHGWPLQRINAAVTPVRQQPTEDTLQVRYHIFDVVDYNRPFIVRAYTDLQQSIACIIKNCSMAPISMVLTAKVYNSYEADLQYSQFVEDKYEGMMYRLDDCPYTVPKQFRGVDKNNRCFHLLKRKDWHDDEFVCEAVLEGEGKYRHMAGALGFSSKTGRPFTVGSGLSDGERTHYWQSPQDAVGHTWKIKYLVLSSDGIPLNPTILTIL
jgi:ATP-dependent DNA ligase